ncbi:MAG: acyloxyacyl hydrolase [Alphaproteobacteria bacterium]|nr:acyloxyacyl hydrolase [Alphaproteobacteria bacterium]
MFISIITIFFGSVNSLVAHFTPYFKIFIKWILWPTCGIIFCMKSVLILGLILIPCATIANPMFENGTRNSIGVYIGQSTGHGDLGHLVWPWDWEFNPMTIAMVQYSQPINFLRLPGRINVHLLQNFAYRHNDGASFGAIGISWDLALASICGWYFGVGIGPYMRDSGDKYVESRLVFGERVFIGKNIGERIRAEFFTQHFSNGDFTNLNRGFNFLGLGINYSF